MNPMPASRGRKGAWLAIAAICAITTFGVCFDAAAGEDPVTITGTVRASERGSRGEVRRIYLDAGEELIAIARREKGKELLTQVGATVKVTGYLRKTYNDEAFKRVIDVTEYTVEKPAPRRPAPPPQP